MENFKNTFVRLAARFRVIGHASSIYRRIKRKRDEAVLGRAESILLRAIALGKMGKFRIVPEFISVSATDNCNLKCVMCPGHAGMSGPKLSVNDAEFLFSSLIDKDANFGYPKVLDMTAGEPTLNPNLGPIYARFKELFPDAKISMISNATVPIRGRIREAFMHADRIGLSMDGATVETYERIRKGSIYKNVVRNVKDIGEMKKLGINCESLHLMFVAMNQNIHELPEMVRLAHSLGIPALFGQVAELRSESPFNGEGQNVSLSLSKSEVAPFVREAKAEAERLGISLELTSELQEAIEPIQSTHNMTDAEHNSQRLNSFEVAIRTCHVPWVNAPRIAQNNDGIYPTTVCCHMPNDLGKGNLSVHSEFKGKSINAIFNSEFYWNIRSGLLDGTLAKDACEGCQYYQMTQWTGAQLRELERATEVVERSIKIRNIEKL
jgi:molybdenum cofactor biosynthesis enzyme MoaA